MYRHVFSLDDCARLNPAEGVTIFATEAERMTLTVMDYEPGTVLPEHSHAHEQMGYMVEGEAEFVIGGTSHHVVAGQLWRLPGGVLHQVKVGPKPRRVIECFCPPREDFRA